MAIQLSEAALFHAVDGVEDLKHAATRPRRKAGARLPPLFAGLVELQALLIHMVSERLGHERRGGIVEGGARLLEAEEAGIEDERPREREELQVPMRQHRIPVQALTIMLHEVAEDRVRQAEAPADAEDAPQGGISGILGQAQGQVLDEGAPEECWLGLNVERSNMWRHEDVALRATRQQDVMAEEP